LAEINKNQIKLLQSQNLDDTSEGGGQMTVHEVVDGNVNNLFPDISRLDRTYGRVSLRKAFLSVQTEDRSVYYGSHVALTQQAEDPLVNALIFTTQNWSDRRDSCRNRIEAYLAKGPQLNCGVWGDHYSGTRLITTFMELDWAPPEVGDVIVIQASKNLVGASITPVEQYVRIVNVETAEKAFTDSTGSFVKQEVKLSFGRGIEFDIPGNTPSRIYSYGASSVYSTTVADASKYYGVSKLAEPITAGALDLVVDTIMTAIVPSANSQTAITDFGVGMSRPAMVGADNQGRELSMKGASSFAAGASIVIGYGILPGSFYFVYNVEVVLTDDSRGNILNTAGVIVGAINYVAGTLTIGDVGLGDYPGGTYVFQPATEYPTPVQTGAIAIRLANRGFVYVYNCVPSPKPMTLRVDYLSNQKWYSLYDIGGGEIKGRVPSLGSGTVNYLTGSVSLSLGAMPDIESNIMFYWGTEVDSININSEDRAFFHETDFYITGEASYGTLEVTWDVFDYDTDTNYEYMVKDNGDGILDWYVGGSLLEPAIGTFNKFTKRVKFVHFRSCPQSEQEYDVTYSVIASGSQGSDSFNGDGDGTITYMLSGVSGDIKPGTVRVSIPIVMNDIAIGASISVTTTNANSWSNTESQKSSHSKSGAQSGTVSKFDHSYTTTPIVGWTENN